MPPIELNGAEAFIIFALVILPLAVFWIVQFRALMTLPDRAFPGPYVRFGWVAAFILLWVLAPFAFIAYRYEPPRRGSRRVKRKGDGPSSGYRESRPGKSMSDNAVGDEEAAPAEEAPREPWTCDRCGEPSPHSFDICWNCHGPRPGSS